MRTLGDENIAKSPTNGSPQSQNDSVVKVRRVMIVMKRRGFLIRIMVKTGVVNWHNFGFGEQKRRLDAKHHSQQQAQTSQQLTNSNANPKKEVRENDGEKRLGENQG